MCTGHDSSSVHPKEGERRKRHGGRKKERKKERKRQEGKCPGNDSRRCEEWRGKGKERNKRDNRTLLRHRKRKTCHNIHHNRPKGWVEGGKVNQGVKRGGGDAELKAVIDYRLDSCNFDKHTALALIAVNQMFGSRGGGQEGGWRGVRMSCRMFLAKRLRSWQKLNMSSGKDQTLRLCHTHTNRKTCTHANGKDALTHTHTHTHTHTPGLQLQGGEEGESAQLTATEEKAMRHHNTKGLGMKRRRRAPDLHAGQTKPPLCSLKLTLK